VVAKIKVIEAEHFPRIVERIRAKFNRIDEYVQAVTWLLQRSPAEGKILPEPMANYRILNIGPALKGLPTVWVAYSFHGDIIKLFDIKIPE